MTDLPLIRTYSPRAASCQLFNVEFLYQVLHSQLCSFSDASVSSYGLTLHQDYLCSLVLTIWAARTRQVIGIEDEPRHFHRIQLSTSPTSTKFKDDNTSLTYAKATMHGRLETLKQLARTSRFTTGYASNLEIKYGFLVHHHCYNSGQVGTSIQASFLS